MKTLFAILLLASAVNAQDKVTFTVQRGTVTRTAVIDGPAAVEAMRALDFYVSQSSPKPANETAALRELVVAMIAGQLQITPGSPIKAAADALAAADAAFQKARADFLAAAQEKPVQ